MEAREIRSFRNLSTEPKSFATPSELQKFGRGKREPGLLKMLEIIDSIGITFTQFATFFDKLTEQDIEVFIARRDERKKKGHPQSGKSKPRKKKK